MIDKQVSGTTTLTTALAGGHLLQAIAFALALVALVSFAAQTITELFWLRALHKPGADLRRLLDRNISIDEAERLMRLLCAAHRDVLTARTESTAACLHALSIAGDRFAQPLDRLARDDDAVPAQPIRRTRIPSNQSRLRRRPL
ncbi:hypothetical protein [Nocardia brasiliensis]|uniref:hypothetical protein n=1 Tax=Nocardia brasiliensis TaxID=37326 RepID=UPI0033ECD7E2